MLPTLRSVKLLVALAVILAALPVGCRVYGFLTHPLMLLDLDEAAGAGQTERVASLLNLGADPTDPSSTALVLAANEGHVETVQLLLAHGARVNQVDWSGRTPLHQAVAHHHLEVVRCLLRAGADPEARDRNGKTPRSLAHRKEFADLLRLLDPGDAQNRQLSPR